MEMKKACIVFVKFRHSAHVLSVVSYISLPQKLMNNFGRMVLEFHNNEDDHQLMVNFLEGSSM
jgi:hypothetical protein